MVKNKDTLARNIFERFMENEPYPDFSSKEDEDAWIEFSYLAGQVAGLIHTCLLGGQLDREIYSQIQHEVLAAESLKKIYPDRWELLISGLNVLKDLKY